MFDLQKNNTLIMVSILLSYILIFSSCGKDEDLFLDAVIEDAPIDDVLQLTINEAGNKDISTATALRIFYVAVNGSADNDGLSEQKPIDIYTAFDIDKIQPGDLYWVKAGDYGKINIELNQPNKTAGTEENPIGWVGYKDTPGDIKAVKGPTVSWDDYIKKNHDLDSTVMPTFSGDTSEAPNFLNNGRAIDINYKKDYLVIRNLQFRHYHTSILMRRSKNVIFDNVIMVNNGYFDDIPGQGGTNANLKGYGLTLATDTGYSKISNCYSANMALRAFSISENSSYNVIEYSESDTDTEHNPQDYFFYTTGKYNVFRNIAARKLTESNHSGHGLCFNWDNFYTENGAAFNYAENVEILNTSLHFDGETCHDNTVKNIKLWEDRDHYIYGTSIVFMDGAHDNTVDVADLSEGAITFFDSGAHVNNGNAGHDNTIRNATVSNNGMAIDFGSWSTTYAAYNNQFVDCTFKNLDKGIFQVSRENHDNKFIGCTIENVPKVWFEDSKSRDYLLDSSTEFTDCNFWNSEIPSNTVFKVSGTTEKAPSN